MKGEIHIEVARPANEVFDFLADIRNERSWNPRIIKLDKISEGPIGAGTRFHGLYSGIGELTTELVVFRTAAGVLVPQHRSSNAHRRAICPDADSDRHRHRS